MESDSLLKLWELWLEGNDISQYFLYFTSVKWWGRIGKILEFCGAILIAIDIVGEKKLKNFGSFLKKRITEYSIIDQLKISLKCIWNVVTGSDKDIICNNESAYHSALSVLYWLVATVYIFYQLGSIVSIIAFLLAGMVPLMAISTITASLTLALISTVLYVCYLLFILPVTKILLVNNRERVIRTAGIVVFVIGFHFDLLAS